MLEVTLLGCKKEEEDLATIASCLLMKHALQHDLWFVKWTQHLPGRSITHSSSMCECVAAVAFVSIQLGPDADTTRMNNTCKTC